MSIRPEHKIIAARKQKGITQEDFASLLAKKLGQSYSTRQYQKIENGEFPKYKKEIVRAIDEILGISVTPEIYEQRPEQSEVHKFNTDEKVSPMEILSVLAGAFDKQADAFRSQAEMMKNIEKNMARQDSQAIIDANLKEVLAGVLTLADRQEPAIKQILSDLAELKRRKSGP